MGKLVIQYHDFENAKKEIKNFSEQTTTDLDLKRVEDSKGIGEFWGDLFLGRGIGKDHMVRGEELNDLTSQIQKYLYSINNTQIKLIKEFGQVYNALEALDKDYIQAIVASIKATEETSEGVKETKKQNKKLANNQRKTLETLKKLEPLSEIEKQNIAASIQETSNTIESLTIKIKYVCCIAGGAAVLAIIELILLLLRG